MAMMTMMTTTVAVIEQSYYRRSRRRRTTTIPTSTSVVAATKSRSYILSLLLFLIVGGTTNVLVSTAFVITATTTTTHNNNNNHYHDELRVRRKKTTTTKSMTKHLSSSSSFRTSTTPLCAVHPQQQRHDNINDENVENTDTKELLSVAPMMGHTNRHYRYYYRLLSKRTYLYTEMMPSSQIVSAYNRAKEIYSNNLPKSELESNSIIPTPTEIINLVQQVIDNPSLEYQSAALASKSLPYEVLTLHQLLATSCIQESPVVLQLGGNDPTTLGVAAAIGAAWGRWNQDNPQQNSQQQSHQRQSQSQHSQSHYIAINLNCGCPSNAVGGRAGGCALMTTPELVLECVDSMRSSIDEIYNTLTLLQEESSSLLLSEQQQSKQQQSSQSILSKPPPPPTITVKHRLGIRDALSYNATFDRLQNDDEAFNDVSSFIRIVSSNDSVSTFHVHARLGILGDFVDDTNEDGNDEAEDDDDENNNNKKKKKKKIKQTLWVPTDDDDGTTTTNTTTDTNTDNNNKDGEGEEIRRIKIDHKREQEKARRRSRRSTIKNRDVPPLRPNVIYKLTTEFPHLDFVSNGGITNMREVVKEVTGNGDGSVMGAMVGRTIINHPCSFAAADRLLWNTNTTNSDDDDITSSSSSSSNEIKRRPTRGDILLKYIKYCDEEEDRIVSYGASQQHMENLRRRLIAVPYHLFVGENGSDKYQRRIIKLKDKLQRVVTTTSTASSGTTTNEKNKNPNQWNKKNASSMTSMKASTILKGAMSFIPKATLDKCIDDYVEWDDIPKYDHLGGLKRGSALQRVVY